MNEEIKEIMDRLQDSVNYPKIDMPTFDGSDSEYIDNDTLLEPNKCKQLLNYITNLQEENIKLVKVIEEIKFVFDNPENHFSDGCDCRVIEDIINKLTELKGGSENE